MGAKEFSNPYTTGLNKAHPHFAVSKGITLDVADCFSIASSLLSPNNLEAYTRPKGAQVIKNAKTINIPSFLLYCVHNCSGIEFVDLFFYRIKQLSTLVPCPIA